MRWWRQTVAWWSSKLGWNEASWQRRRAAALKRELCSLNEHDWRDHERLKGVQQCSFCYDLREKNPPRPGDTLLRCWRREMSLAANEGVVIGRHFYPVHADEPPTRPRRKAKPKRKRRGSGR